MKRISIIVALSIAASAIAGPASGNPTLYAGLGMGSSSEAGSMSGVFEESTATEGDSWRLFAGLEVSRYFGVELARLDLGNRTCCRNVADFGFATSVEGYSAAVLGRLPLNRFSLFAKVGLLGWEEEGTLSNFGGPTAFSEDGTSLLVGGGLDVDLWRGLAARVDWESLEIGERSSDQFWLSILYRF